MLKEMDFDHLLENVKKLFGAGLDALRLLPRNQSIKQVYLQ